jgi:hypothetical protein
MSAAANLGGIGGASSASIDASCIGGAAIAATPWAVANQIPTPAIATPTVIFGTKLGHYDHPGLRLALSLAGNLHRVVQGIIGTNNNNNASVESVVLARLGEPGRGWALLCTGSVSRPSKLRGARAHSFSYLSEARSDAAREHPQRRSGHPRNHQTNLAITCTPPVRSLAPAPFSSCNPTVFPDCSFAAAWQLTGSSDHTIS